MYDLRTALAVTIGTIITGSATLDRVEDMDSTQNALDKFYSLPSTNGLVLIGDITQDSEPVARSSNNVRSTVDLIVTAKTATAKGLLSQTVLDLTTNLRGSRLGHDEATLYTRINSLGTLQRVVDRDWYHILQIEVLATETSTVFPDPQPWPTAPTMVMDYPVNRATYGLRDSGTFHATITNGTGTPVLSYWTWNVSGSASGGCRLEGTFTASFRDLNLSAGDCVFDAWTFDSNYMWAHASATITLTP